MLVWYNSSMDKVTLRQRQLLPLEAKIVWSQERIREFYEKMDGNVYVAFSGGKDSSVVLSLVRELYPQVPAVFNNTGQEFPEIRSFVKQFPNVIKLRPTTSYRDVIEEYGWPVISKKVASSICHIRQLPRDSSQAKAYFSGIAERWWYLPNAPFKISDRCCEELKKKPSKMYEKATGRKAYLGMMAADSDLRELTYMKRGGCNSYGRSTSSWPVAIWTEKDIWDYLTRYNIPYSKIYDHGFSRTGCMTCLFGIHLDCGFRGENRIQTMKRTHSYLWDFYMRKTRLREVMEFLNMPIEPFGI